MQTKLNIGAGPTNFGSDWIHIDAANYKHITENDIYLYKWPKESVDLIYSSHTLEYFSWHTAFKVLTEWKRTLKLGGILYLAVPDFEAMAKLYISKKCKLQDIIGPLYGRMQSNRKWIYHKTVYDYEKLYELLNEVGYKNINKYDWNQISPFNKVDDQSKAYLPKCPECIKKLSWTSEYTLISLNVMAVK